MVGTNPIIGALSPVDPPTRVRRMAARVSALVVAIIIGVDCSQAFRPANISHGAASQQWGRLPLSGRDRFADPRPDGLIGGMLVFVVIDGGRKIRDRRKERIND